MQSVFRDFGVSGRLGGAVTVAGTPLYMAPEAFHGRASPASDVYGLAATLFHLVAGVVPFPAASWGELTDLIGRGLPHPDPRLERVPAVIEGVIREGLAADVTRRPPLSEFADRLRGALNGSLAADLAGDGDADLWVAVDRADGAGGWRRVAASRPPGGRRNMAAVPPEPERVRLITGDRVRVVVGADREGYATVFNVGPKAAVTAAGRPGAGPWCWGSNTTNTDGGCSCRGATPLRGGRRC